MTRPTERKELSDRRKYLSVKTALPRRFILFARSLTTVGVAKKVTPSRRLCPTKERITPQGKLARPSDNGHGQFQSPEFFTALQHIWPNCPENVSFKTAPLSPQESKTKSTVSLSVCPRFFLKSTDQERPRGQALQAGSKVFLSQPAL